MAPTSWQPDALGPDFSTLTFELGTDPDGEGQIVATLIRHDPPADSAAAVLYVHGFTDYFFQRELAEFFTSRGHTFYALDLRKCGRSQRPGQTPHQITDLQAYDVELNLAMSQIDADTGGAPVIVAAHSTGGLITPLWLDRLRAAGRSAESGRPAGLILNSPWFELQGAPILRSVGTTVINSLGRVRPMLTVPVKLEGAYGRSLHESVHGEWAYNLDYKPLDGYPVTFGFLSAVRQGQARLHRGIDVGVPSLVLRSDATIFSGRGPNGERAHIDSADAVLDTRQIARWAGCLGDRVSVVPVSGARHDVFLSTKDVRDLAYTETENWLRSNQERIRGTQNA